MNDDLHTAVPISNTPVRVDERVVRSAPCPNCQKHMDITGAAVGTMVKCSSCENITWVPAFKPRWWQKAPVIIGGGLVSIFLAAAGGFFADILIDFRDENPGPEIEKTSGKSN